ncbi:MAG: archease [Candidatus Sungbacteria bacterium]|nr:archease [Candidatus Sungbacteria bacterium]
MEHGFEILEDVSGPKMRVWGNSIKDLFLNALSGVAVFVKPEILENEKKEKPIRQKIEVKAVDLNSLLVEFLSESLTQSDIHGALFHTASFKDFGDNFLKGTLSGFKTGEFANDIKAISDSEVDIKKNLETGMYETILVFDV